MRKSVKDKAWGSVTSDINGKITLGGMVLLDGTLEIGNVAASQLMSCRAPGY